MGRQTDTQRRFHEQMKELDPNYKPKTSINLPFKFLPFLLIAGLIFYVYYYNQNEIGFGGSTITTSTLLGNSSSSNIHNSSYYENLDPSEHEGNAEHSTNRYVRSIGKILNVTILEDEYSLEDIVAAQIKLDELSIPKDSEAL